MIDQLTFYCVVCRVTLTVVLFDVTLTFALCVVCAPVQTVSRDMDALQASRQTCEDQLTEKQDELSQVINHSKIMSPCTKA